MSSTRKKTTLGCTAVLDCTKPSVKQKVVKNSLITEGGIVPKPKTGGNATGKSTA